MVSDENVIVYDFEAHRTGTSFLGLTVDMDITPAVDLTGATIYLWLRKDKPDNPNVALKLSTGGNGITINSPTQFQIDEQIISIPSGLYYYDCLIKFASGRIRPYLKGTWLFIENVSVPV